MKKKQIEGGILAEGEATGHKHRVSVAVMEREDGVREFEGATEVLHEEHKTISLPNRKWNSGIVREIDPYSDMVRQVRD